MVGELRFKKMWTLLCPKSHCKILCLIVLFFFVMNMIFPVIGSSHTSRGVSENSFENHEKKNGVRGPGSPGYGLVAPNSTVTPTIDGIKGADEWSDAKSDVVSIGGNDLYRVYSKIKGDIIYVSVELDQNLTDTVQNNDHCALVFDLLHDGGGAPLNDDLYVECLYQTGGVVNTTKVGDGTTWQNMPWPDGWDAYVDDLGGEVFYEFKINISDYYTPVEGYVLGFGVKLKSGGFMGDNIYWPDEMNPGDDPENIPDRWGHMIYERPMLLINRVDPDGTGNEERIVLYNNCSTEVRLDNVTLTNQNGDNLLLPILTIPSYHKLNIYSGSGEDDYDFSDGYGTVYLEDTELWNDTGDDVLLMFDVNNCAFDYMQYGGGSEVDPHPADSTSNSGWIKDTANLTSPSGPEYLIRKTDGFDTNRSSDWILAEGTQPDLWIDGDGDDLYLSEPMGDQVNIKRINGGDNASWWVVLQNDGMDEDTFYLNSSSRMSTDWEWGLIDNSTGSIFLNDSMTTNAVSLNSSEWMNFTLNISSPLSASAGDGSSVVLKALSQNNTYLNDSVNATAVIRDEYQPDLWDDEKSEGHYVDTPDKNQTRHVNVLPGEEGSFRVNLTNDGGNIDSFNITWNWPLGRNDTGWEAWAWDLTNGTNITADLEAGAYKTSPLSTSDSITFSINISSPSTAFYGDVSDVVFNATSTNNTDKKDSFLFECQIWAVDHYNITETLGGTPILDQDITVDNIKWGNVSAWNDTYGGYIGPLNCTWSVIPSSDEDAATGDGEGIDECFWSGTVPGMVTWRAVNSTVDSRWGTTSYDVNFTIQPGPPASIEIYPDTETLVNPGDDVAISCKVMDEFGNPVADGTNISFEWNDHEGDNDNANQPSLSPIWNGTTNGWANTTLQIDPNDQIGDDYNVTGNNVTFNIKNTTARIVVEGSSSNPLHHIELTPMYTYPSSNDVSVDNTITGYTAVGWNDAAETEKNQTWTPTWGTTDGLGSAIDTGGDWDSGYTADYEAGTNLGFDNITVHDSSSTIGNSSCIQIVPGESYEIVIISGNDQEGRAGSMLSEPFVVEVRDEFDNPVGAGGNVWFNITTTGLNGDGTLSTTNPVLTDENGRANTTLTLDSEPGTNNVAGEIAGDGISQVNFTAVGRAPPQIEIEKTVDVLIADPGDEVIYTIWYNNTGEEDAAHVWINDTFDSHLEYIDSEESYQYQDEDTYGWHFNDVSVGEHHFTITCMVKVGTADGTSIYNSAHLDYTDSDGNKMNPMDSNQVSINATASDISIEKEVDNKQVEPGENLNYTINYFNLGNGTAKDVWINDTFDPNLEYIEASVPYEEVNGDTYCWHFDDVDPGSYTLTIRLEVISDTSDGVDIYNQAVVNYSDANGNYLMTKESNEVVTTVREEIENEPPSIEGVPDLVVHYDLDYSFDLTPYISDPDNESSELILSFSDPINARVNETNNLGMILNYPESLNGTTVSLTIWVSDGIASDSDTIKVQITSYLPPKLKTPLPDVTFDEDTIYHGFDITEYFLNTDDETEYYSYGSTNITVTILDNGTVRFVPDADWFGIEDIIFRATHPSGAFVEDAISVTVVPVNDPPWIDDVPVQEVKANKVHTLNLTPYLGDVDDDISDLKLSVENEYVTVVGQTLVLNYPGGVTSDEITVTVSDGELNDECTILVEINQPSIWEKIYWPWPIVPFLFIIPAILFYYYRRTVVDDVFLIYETGVLIAHETRRMRPNFDDDLFSGMLTAIQDFAKDSFKDEESSEIKKLEFADKKILLERGEHVFMAVVYSGRATKPTYKKMRKTMERIEDEYGDVLASWEGDTEDIRGIKEELKGIF